MKKFLTAIAALALAGTMAFGFAACADGDTPADGGNNQEQTGGNTTGGNTTGDNTTGGQSTNRKLTEAEWKAAWEEFDTYDNYTVISDHYSLSDGTKEKASQIIQKRDGNIILTSISYEGSTSMIYQCYVLKSEDVICYQGDGEHWSLYSLDNYIKDIYRDLFASVGVENTVFHAEVNGEELKGTFYELYSAFTYDESTNSYTATLISYSIDESTGQEIKDEYSVDETTIYFENGKVTKIADKSTVAWAGSYTEGVVTLGGVELEEPTVNS